MIKSSTSTNHTLPHLIQIPTPTLSYTKLPLSPLYTLSSLLFNKTTHKAINTR